MRKVFLRDQIGLGQHDKLGLAAEIVAEGQVNIYAMNPRMSRPPDPKAESARLSRKGRVAVI